MKSRSLLLLAGAITLATGTALVARVLMRPPAPVTVVKEVQAPKAKTRQMLVASRPLAPGDFIDGGALAWHDVAADAIRADYLTAVEDEQRRQYEREFFGATARHNVAAGEPLSRELFVYPGQPGFLAAVLMPGMRAVSIPTSMVASNAGLVSAGDRVDVILSLSRDNMVAPSQQPNSIYTALAAQTIVHNVRVLALNSDATSIAPAPLPPVPVQEEGNDKDKNQDSSKRRAALTAQARATAPLRGRYESITLEVTPAEAEQLALTREVGTLQLALRGAREADSDISASRGVTRLRQATSIFTDAPAPITVQTFHGSQPGAAVFGKSP